MRAERALVSGLGALVNKAGIVRAGVNAISAAHAAVAINHNDAILLLVGSFNGTNGYAGRVFAVIAQPGQHKRGQLTALLMLHFVLGDRGSKLAKRGGVLNMARHCASLAADALAKINQHAVALCGITFPSSRLLINACLGKARKGYQCSACT